MSAFLVNSATIQAAVEGILFGEDARWSDFLEYPAADVTKLGQELWDMNQSALGARYGDNEPAPKFKGKAFSRRMRGYQPQDVQRFKSLQCLMYQCAEGDVPETDLFKRIEAASGKLAAKIVSSLPAYDAAGWGDVKAVAI